MPVFTPWNILDGIGRGKDAYELQDINRDSLLSSEMAVIASFVAATIIAQVFCYALKDHAIRCLVLAGRKIKSTLHRWIKRS